MNLHQFAWSHLGPFPQMRVRKLSRSNRSWRAERFITYFWSQSSAQNLGPGYWKGALATAHPTLGSAQPSELPRPACMLISPGSFLVRDAKSLTWIAAWQMPQRAGCPAQGLHLLTVLLLLFLPEHLSPAALIQKFSHIHAFLISLCPDCIVSHRVMLTAPSLVFWGQVSFPPILPLHNSHNNFSQMHPWLSHAVALKAMPPFRMFPLVETFLEVSICWKPQYHYIVWNVFLYTLDFLPCQPDEILASCFYLPNTYVVLCVTTYAVIVLCSKHLTNNLYNTPIRKVLLLTHFTDKGTKA